MRGNRVRQSPRIINTGDGSQDLGRNLLVELDVLVELLGDGPAQRLDLRAALARRRHRGDVTNEMVALVANRLRRGALHTLHQHLDRAVRQLEHLQDAGQASHFKHVLGLGLILASGLLGNQHDLTAGLHGSLQGLDRLGAAHKEWDHHVREHHHVAQRQQRQRDRIGRKYRMT